MPAPKKTTAAKATPKKTTRQRTGSELPESMAAANPALQDFSREDKAHGKDRAPRVPMNTGDLSLTVAPGVIPEGMVGRWFEDRPGRIETAKAAYWEHVTDSNGSNITRHSGDKLVYLMAIEKKYYDEDQAAKMKNYLSTVGESDDDDLKSVEGVEAYTPDGHENKTKISDSYFS